MSKKKRSKQLAKKCIYKKRAKSAIINTEQLSKICMVNTSSFERKELESMKKQSSSKVVCTANESASKVKRIPLHVQVAIDLYINRMTSAEVANKYNRTKRQISWLNSKSIKKNLNAIWAFGHKRSKYLKISGETPLYMQVAAKLINGKSIEQVASYYNKSTVYVKRIISIIKKKLPYMYKFMNEVKC